MEHVPSGLVTGILATRSGITTLGVLDGWGGITTLGVLDGWGGITTLGSWGGITTLDRRLSLWPRVASLVSLSRIAGISGLLGFS